MASETVTIDAAFGPYIVLFALISLFLFTRGVWMTTPDKESEAFCYKDSHGHKDSLVAGGVGDFDSAAGGGMARKNQNKGATHGYEYDRQDSDIGLSVQLPERALNPTERAAAES